MHRIVFGGEEGGMDLGMKRLDAPAEQRGCAGHVLHGARDNALARERGARAVRRDEIPTEVTQRARERDETSAIRNREERSQSVHSIATPCRSIPSISSIAFSNRSTANPASTGRPRSRSASRWWRTSSGTTGARAERLRLSSASDR